MLVFHLVKVSSDFWINLLLFSDMRSMGFSFGCPGVFLSRTSVAVHPLFFSTFSEIKRVHSVHIKGKPRGLAIKYTHWFWFSEGRAFDFKVFNLKSVVYRVFALDTPNFSPCNRRCPLELVNTKRAQFWTRKHKLGYNPLFLLKLTWIYAVLVMPSPFHESFCLNFL